jgi:hypothetical protein
MKRISNGYVTFKSALVTRDNVQACLDGTGSTFDEAPVQLWQCGDDYDNQYWKVVLAHDGYLLLEKRATGYCLHSTGTREGAPNPYLTTCDVNNHDQHWKIDVR